MVDKDEVSATQDIETHHDSKQKKKRTKLIGGLVGFSFSI